MKNLIKAITTEYRNRLENFISEINAVQDKKGLETWQYNDLLPKGKDVSSMTLEAHKAYVIGRKEKLINKSIEREVDRIKSVMAAGELLSVKISMEWKKSRMWGSNPKAECWYTYKKDGDTHSNYVTSELIGGCGYDKGSTAVAQCLNQIPELLKALYLLKEKAIDTKNHELLGYGSGYGILPNIEGGVGVSCYPRIMEKIGLTFETVSSGKTYDAYTMNKLSKVTSNN